MTSNCIRLKFGNARHTILDSEGFHEESKVCRGLVPGVNDRTQWLCPSRITGLSCTYEGQNVYQLREKCLRLPYCLLYSLDMMKARM